MATLCNEIKQKIGDTGRTGADEFTAFREGLIQSVSLMAGSSEKAAEAAAEKAAEAAAEVTAEDVQDADGADLGAVIEDMTKAELEKIENGENV